MALRILTPLAAALVLLAGSASTQTVDATRPDEARVRLAAELRALADGADPAPVGQRLAALPPPTLLEALGSETLTVDGAALDLGEREHAALLQAARLLGRAAFVAPWHEAAAGADGAARRATIELVGHLGTGVDADVAVRAATPLDERAPLDGPALERLEEAAKQLLARAPDALVGLRPPLLRTRPEVAGRILRAVGGSGDPRALEFLADLLGFDEALDLPLLSEIERASRATAPPFPERIRSRVRSYLASSDRQLARSAAMTVAELEDEDSLPVLVELCATSDPALAGASYRALERTTGLALPRRAALWQAWMQGEQRWARENGERVLAALGGDDASAIVRALQEVAPHRLERQRFSLLAAQHLRHEDARVRLEACRTLRALDSSAGRRALKRATGDPDPLVAAAAQQALGVEPESVASAVTSQ